MIYQLPRTPRKWRKIKNSNIWSSFRIVSQQTRNTWNSYVLIIHICSKLNFRTPHHDYKRFCEKVVKFEVLTQKSNEFFKGPSVMKNFLNLQKLCKHIWNITKKKCSFDQIDLTSVCQGTPNPNIDYHSTFVTLRKF